MAKIQLLNKISKVGLKQFDDKYEIGDAIADPDAILVPRNNDLQDLAGPAGLLGINPSSSLCSDRLILRRPLR